MVEADEVVSELELEENVPPIDVGGGGGGGGRGEGGGDGGSGLPVVGIPILIPTPINGPPLPPLNTFTGLDTFDTPSVSDSPIECSFHSAHGSGLNYLQMLEPYGPSGWRTDGGDVIYQRIHVCETQAIDSGDNRFVFWTVEEWLTARSNWHVRSYFDCPCPEESRTGEVFEVSLSEGSFLDEDPAEVVTGGCDTEKSFGLGISVGDLGAELSWTKSLCSTRELVAFGSGNRITWWGQALDEPPSKQFTYGFVTKVVAGAASVVDVHHEARFCRFDCVQNANYAGDYWMAAYTSPSCSKTAAVRLYEHINFSGSCIALGNDDDDFTNNELENGLNLNDVISSIEVADGYEVEIYEHIQYGGSIRTLQTTSNLVDHAFNDLASSIRVTAA